MSHWALLKASTVFWIFCNSGNSKKYGTMPHFVWQIACRQLCYLKAMAKVEQGPADAAGTSTVVLPQMYVALRPDAKFIKQRALKMEGQGSLFSQGLDFDTDVDDDD